MKYLVFIAVLCTLMSCASSVKVNYDYDQNTDFSNYATYNYFADMNTGLNDLDTRRLLIAVDSVMQAKGIQYSEEPDFFINIQSSAFYDARRGSVGVGMGGTNGNVGGGVSVGIPIGGNSVETELVFDFVDSQKNALFWQAVSLSSINDNAFPKTREKKMREIVAKVFANYPPARK